MAFDFFNEPTEKPVKKTTTGSKKTTTKTTTKPKIIQDKRINALETEIKKLQQDLKQLQQNQVHLEDLNISKDELWEKICSDSELGGLKTWFTIKPNRSVRNRKGLGDLIIGINELIKIKLKKVNSVEYPEVANRIKEKIDNGAII